MNNPPDNNSLSLKLGYWSASLAALTFLVFIVCFVSIIVTGPPFTWTNLNNYIKHLNENNQIFLYIAQVAMLLFGPLYIIIVSSIYDYAPAGRKVLAQIGLSFGIIFTVLIGMSYFIQLSVIRLNLAREVLDGLEFFIMVNPSSIILAILMLGWTLFFGLSSLFIAPIFSGGRLENTIKIAFLANGIFCLLGGVGFVFDIKVLVFAAINFGMGAAVMVATIALTHLFKKRLETQRSLVWHYVWEQIKKFI